MTLEIWYLYCCVPDKEGFTKAQGQQRALEALNLVCGSKASALSHLTLLPPHLAIWEVL